MAKKKPSKPVKNENRDTFATLPQNIMNMGEHVEEDKNIYISQRAYKNIHSFTKDKTVNESGGILVGDIIYELGKTNILISDFIEAKYCEGTPTTLTFTHESWEYIHKEMAKYPGKKIIGWIHTHPNFGIFLSEYDKFIQENFFKEDYEVAYVVDPIQNIEGFYFWINGRIERCKGFYIYDETGKEISIGKEDDKTVESKKIVKSPALMYLTIALSVAVIVLLFAFAKNTSEINELKRSITKLQTQQKNLVDSANNSLGIMSVEIDNLTKQIEALEATDTIHDDNIELLGENLTGLIDTINSWIEKTAANGDDGAKGETSVDEENGADNSGADEQNSSSDIESKDGSDVEITKSGEM